MPSIPVKTGGMGCSLYNRISFNDLPDLKQQLIDTGVEAYTLECLDRYDNRSVQKVRNDIEALDQNDIDWVTVISDYENRALILHY